MNSYWNISALDGRYADKVSELQGIASEAALNRYRYVIEIHWLLHLNAQTAIKPFIGLSAEQCKTLDALATTVSQETLQTIKDIERTTNHDVKAVEYCLQQTLKTKNFPEKALAFIHFACTSEDINNLAYALMLRDYRDQILMPNLKNILAQNAALIQKTADLAMMARTHGQPASPTTLGKEIAVFSYRLQRKWRRLQQLEILGKCNGATGNYNAHCAAFPELDWPSISRDFIEKKLKLSFNPLTTQIENHDNLAEWCNEISAVNTILIDYCRDVWGYISLGYFRQKTKAGEVGSSTMPHKVNPIDFENAEGNFGVANALLKFLAEKLPISRWQRDLSDSTVLRTLGTCWGHGLLAFKALSKGLDKLEFSEEAMQQDLERNPELLGEAVQTVLRKFGNADAYDLLKEASRGKRADKNALLAVIKKAKFPISEDALATLQKLEPSTYLGFASNLAKTQIL